MTDNVKEAPFPVAIRKLIDMHNMRMNEYQQNFLREIQEAAVELMVMAGLNPQDGWRMDLENMKFIKVDSDGTTQVK